MMNRAMDQMFPPALSFEITGNSRAEASASGARDRLGPITPPVDTGSRHQEWQLCCMVLAESENFVLATYR